MNDKELSDRLRRLSSGEKEELEPIYNHLKIPLYSVIYRIVYDKMMTEDIMQTVFLKILSSPPDEKIESVKAWIFRIARNEAIDVLRRERRLQLAADIEQEGFTDPTILLDIENGLMKLRLDEREIVTLHLNGGFKFKEIADITEKPLGTVLWKYRKAIDQLRNYLLGGIE